MTERPLGERVAAMEALLPEIRDDIRSVRQMLERRLDAHDGDLSDHDARLSRLERWQSWVLGAAAAISLVAGAVGAWWGGQK